ncbi:hypothetical protein PWY87_24605 [Kribbella solani]|uniref:hypothetical protein n=1 Tax=Kribbella solani TaxID=236067 RepID=UPI0029BBEF41|nr:hypothetical protein [Kribbella solani]MDX2973965.1 hypothetical protein [Kribbella solani]MDX3004888.1 hypothetical protein [Kribbella solani]
MTERLQSGKAKRVRAIGLKAGAVAIRAAAFVVCPGDDIAAAAMPAVSQLTGHGDEHHHEEVAVLPRQPVVVARLPMDRREGGPDPGPNPNPPPTGPVDAGPAAWDVASLYQTFVVEGIAPPGSQPSAPTGPSAMRPPAQNHREGPAATR